MPDYFNLMGGYYWCPLRPRSYGPLRGPYSLPPRAMLCPIDYLVSTSRRATGYGRRPLGSPHHNSDWVGVAGGGSRDKAARVSTPLPRVFPPHVIIMVIWVGGIPPINHCNHYTLSDTVVGWLMDVNEIVIDRP